jgi:FkbH-like protein
MTTPEHSQVLTPRRDRQRQIKCVIWDLDNTIWDGILLEGDAVRLRPEVPRIIQALDQRGILQSLASRNEPQLALAKLREFALEEYFLYPQIGWGSKIDSVRSISRCLDMSPENICFIDDEPFELAGVSSALPDVLCVQAWDITSLLSSPGFDTQVVTQESAVRRQLYLTDMRRRESEQTFSGSHEDFLATLGMVFTIFPAAVEDLQRAEELTNRTNQLNTTGYTYSAAQLAALLRSPSHLLWMSRLRDRFGDYGTVGLTLIECGPTAWTIKLLLMSCRVLNRGVGTVLLNHILHRASAGNVRLLSEFIPSDRNRLMYVTYRLAGFREIENRGAVLVLEHDLVSIPGIPSFLDLRVETAGAPCRWSP